MYSYQFNKLKKTWTAGLSFVHFYCSFASLRYFSMIMLTTSWNIFLTWVVSVAQVKWWKIFFFPSGENALSSVHCTSVQYLEIVAISLQLTRFLLMNFWEILICNEFFCIMLSTREGWIKFWEIEFSENFLQIAVKIITEKVFLACLIFWLNMSSLLRKRIKLVLTKNLLLTMLSKSFRLSSIRLVELSSNRT